jgi:hypothetical protein
MTDATPPDTLWRLVDFEPSRASVEVNGKQVEVDSLTMYLQSAGTYYCVNVVGPKDATNQDILSALRAAAGHVVSLSGGDVTKLGGVDVVQRDEVTPKGAVN